MTAQELLDSINKIDVYEAATVSVQNTSTAYEDEQREQLFAGLNRLDEPITPTYAPRTVQIKKKKGQPFDRVTIRDKGDWYTGIKLEVNGESLIVESSDIKNRDLQKKYGGVILGLGPLAINRYIEILQPEFVRQLWKPVGPVTIL